MHGDVVGLIAFDFVLWIVWAGMMGIPLVIYVFRMNSDNSTGDASGLGIPGDMISNFETLFRFHHLSLADSGEGERSFRREAER
jgi:hypothetical protein